MKEPWFWRDTGFAARAAVLALAPASFLYDLAQRLRAASTRPAQIGAPVICIGNATLGGVGKTPFALMLQKLMLRHGVDAEFQSRGHGGSLKGPVLVGDHHVAAEVGDEPLLLAGAAPTWVAKDRLAGVRVSAHAGAKAIIMDDGLQNPTIRKDLSFLLVDAADPAGNNRVFPAGAAPRADGAGDRARRRRRDCRARRTGDRGVGPPSLSRITEIETTISSGKAVAFCGIGAPDRFFDALEARGFSLAARIAFPDHHRFTAVELETLRRKAATAGAALITTEKDFVRLSPEARDGVAVARLKMSVDNPDALIRLVKSKIWTFS